MPRRSMRTLLVQSVKDQPLSRKFGTKLQCPRGSMVRFVAVEVAVVITNDVGCAVIHPFIGKFRDLLQDLSDALRVRRGVMLRSRSWLGRFDFDGRAFRQRDRINGLEHPVLVHRFDPLAHGITCYEQSKSRCTSKST